MIPSHPSVDRPHTIREKFHNDSREFGDTCNSKEKTCIRVMFQNVNGLGYTNESVKTLSVRNLLYKSEVDIMAMAETNVNWSKLRRHTFLRPLGLQGQKLIFLRDLIYVY